jgi:dolichyl-phosphate beta-glucosyltransferase
VVRPDPARIALSVVVPAYDEAECIGDALRAIAAYLVRRGAACEIVVVDDGSRDATPEIVRDVGSGLAVPLHLIRYGRNRGKGHALRVGFAATRGERVLFTDADLSTPIVEADRLLARIDAGADVVIGSRRSAGAVITVHQPWWREGMGKAFTLLGRALVADVSDITCGFKAFRGGAGRDLFARLRIADWSFDAEALRVARLRGYRVEEVPVTWADRPGTKVRPVRDALRSLLGLVRIRVNSALGRYAQPRPPGVETEVWSAAGAGPGPAVEGRAHR